MKDIVFFNCYCNTEEKQNVLLENIQYVKNTYPNVSIGIHTQYPMNIDFQKIVDVYLYDSENIVLKDKFLIIWGQIPDTNLKVVKYNYDAGWAALNQIRGILFASNYKKYNYVLCCNYDLDCKNDPSFNNVINKNGDFLYNFKSDSTLDKSDGVNMVFFKINTDRGLGISKKLSLSSYLSSNLLPEQYLKSVVEGEFNNLEINRHIPLSKINSSGNKNDAPIWSVNLYNESLKEYFNSIVFCMNKDYGKYTLHIWDKKCDFKMNLKQNGSNVDYILNKKDKISIITFSDYPNELIINYINDKEFNSDLLKFFPSENKDSLFIETIV